MCRVRAELSYTSEQIKGPVYLFFVADNSEAVLGFYALSRPSDCVCELEALFVEPKHIGKGIGRQLIDHAKKIAADLGATSIVLQGDPNALRFYAAAGGAVTGHKDSLSIHSRTLPLITIPLPPVSPG